MGVPSTGEAAGHLTGVQYKLWLGPLHEGNGHGRMQCMTQ